MQADPFHSARLFYRPVDETDDPLFQATQDDTIGNLGAFAGTPKPAGKRSAKEHRDWLDKQLLSVMICLRPDVEHELDFTLKPPSASFTPYPPIDKKAEYEAKPTAIGFITLSPLEGIFAHHRESMIGLQLLAPYRSKGYGSEAIEWILDYGFSLIGLHRIVIGCYGWNDGARRLYDRMGFVLESQKRKSVWYSGRWWDDFGFGMLEEEWRARRRFDEHGQLMID